MGKPKEKYAIHPGYRGKGKNRKYVSAMTLVRENYLPMGSWVIWDDERPRTYAGKNWNDYKHIFAESK